MHPAATLTLNARRHRSAALALLLSSGCSLVGVRAPQPRPLDPARPIECTTSRVLPGLDLLAAIPVGVAGVTMLALATCSLSRDPNTWVDLCAGDKGGVTAAAAGLTTATLALVGSAVLGYKRTDESRAVVAWQQSCLAGDAGSCAALRTPPAPEPVAPIDAAGWEGSPGR